MFWSSGVVCLDNIVLLVCAFGVLVFPSVSWFWDWLIAILFCFYYNLC